MQKRQDERRKTEDERGKPKAESRQPKADSRPPKAAAAALVLTALLVLAANTTFAQSTATAPQNVEVEPVTCWWRAAVATVRVGEPFSVVLTCSALETDAARAVIDRTRLGSAAVQFPPYEVTAGSQSEDHVTAGRRFMQYEYIVRLISEDAFGLDVPINGMEITYRIESQVQPDAAAVQGREQSYTLPAIPMRVSSLVADNATHIREMTVPSIGEIAAREFRARMYRLVALILFGVAALTLAVALVRWARSRRTPAEVAETKLLSHRTVLSGVRSELRDVQQASRGGWTPELVARALSAARVVGSYMTGQPVAQRVSAKQVTNGEVVLRGTLGRRNIAVSGSATAQRLTSLRETTSDVGASDLDGALAQLTTARYGRADLQSGALDDAVDTAIRAADRVAKRFTRVAEAMGSMRQSARGWRPQAWVR